MKNYRITISSRAQFIAADQCDCTPKKIIFYSGKNIMKVIDAAVVKSVEELDNRLRPCKVIFQNQSAVKSLSRKACEEVLKKLLQGQPRDAQ